MHIVNFQLVFKYPWNISITEEDVLEIKICDINENTLDIQYDEAEEQKCLQF